MIKEVVENMNLTLHDLTDSVVDVLSPWPSTSG